jgi:hypothetical protein
MDKKVKGCRGRGAHSEHNDDHTDCGRNWGGGLDPQVSMFLLCRQPVNQSS